jgi:hypothetical protein
MKKPFFAVLLAALAAVSLAAQTGGGASTDVGLLNTRVYGGYFGFRNGDINPDSDYILSAPRAERVNVWSNVGGKDRTIDTPLELALFSYYAASRIDIRPIEAKEVLPANNPKLVDLKLGAATYMEMQMARFSGKDPAPYAAALKFITDRGKVSEADIKRFMAQGIAAEVDAQFNKVSFLLDKTAQVSYNAVLTRNAQNQYVLSYERPSVENDDKELTAPTLQTLLDAMRRNTADFSQTSIDQVRAQAALIPAVKLPPKELEAIKDILTLFYLNPNTGMYNAIRDVYAVYNRLSASRSENKEAYSNILIAYVGAVESLNGVLSHKMVMDVRENPSLASRNSTVEAIAQEVRERRGD